MTLGPSNVFGFDWTAVGHDYRMRVQHYRHVRIRATTLQHAYDLLECIACRAEYRNFVWEIVPRVGF